MDIETAREYCLAKKAVTECLPFDEYSLVMKVMDKMFVLIDLEYSNKICMKCDPEYAIESVSYTHLDVYKRQGIKHTIRIIQIFTGTQTNQPVMRLSMFLIHEMNVIGTNEFNIIFFCKLY